MKNKLLKVWGQKMNFCESLGMKIIFYPYLNEMDIEY